MTRKLAIVFAVLALSYIAGATVDSNSPASVFAVTPGKVFTNGTDTAFTSLTGDCMFTGGFDNTTNYVWCLTAYPSSTVAYTFQRRAINASSPATINSTADTKLATTQYAESITGGVTTCSGAGYFGIATTYGTGTSPNYKPDVYFSYAAVNASSFTKVTLTSNSDTNIYVVPKKCFYDNGIFYIVYTYYHMTQSGGSANLTQNAVYIQGVNVTSGAVYYNSTGGVKLWSPTSQAMSTLSFSGFVGNNQTGYATQGLLLYTDSSSSTAGATKYNMLPITLSTGAAGSVQTLATGAISSGTATASSTWSYTTSILTTYSTSTGATTTYSTSFLYGTGAASATITPTADITSSVGYYVSAGTTTTEFSTYTSGSTYTISSSSVTSTVLSSSSTYLLSSYSTSYSASTGTLTSTVSTTYGMSAFGSLSTYGVVLTQTIGTYSSQIIDYVAYTSTYSNSIFINGSSTASTAANLTNPSGYYLDMVHGFATTDGGYCLIETFSSTTSGAADAVYKDTYYYNGTQTTTSVSLGTYQSSVQAFADATGSIWLGYTVNDDANSSYPLVSAYAGEVLYQNLSASTLSSIFATLAIMIAALFAF